jgi:hypothetical protein
MPNIAEDAVVLSNRFSRSRRAGMAFTVRWIDDAGQQEQRFTDAASAREKVLWLAQPGVGAIETTDDDGKVVQLIDLTALAEQEEGSRATEP